MKKLFIDDERFPVDDSWVIVRTSKEAIDYVKINGLPNFISFDHDLGADDTTRKFIFWLIDELIDENIIFPHDFDFYTHSQNPIGAKWINETMNNLIREFKNPFPIIKHGSENSIDEDIYVIANKSYDIATAKKITEAYLPKNANLITIKDGIVEWSYKGTIDEVNNSILNTFHLHNQNVLTCPILKYVERNKLLKIERTIRGLISHISRTEHRKFIKEALRSNNIQDKISALKLIKFTQIKDFKKNIDNVHIYKFFAFQLGQTMGLIEKNIELFTKNQIIDTYPNLEPYINRKENSNLDNLQHTLSLFISFCEKNLTNDDNNKIMLIQNKSKTNTI